MSKRLAAQPVRLWARGITLAVLLCTARTAFAFTPEFTVGGGAHYRSPHEVRGFVSGEMDVLDYLGVRVEGAVGYAHDNQGALKAVAWAGPTLNLDIATWAPSLFVGIGWRAKPHVLAGVARAELRRYISMHGALGAGIGAEWAAQDRTQLSLSLGYVHRL